jgi:hypothetical protein
LKQEEDSIKFELETGSGIRTKKVARLTEEAATTELGCDGYNTHFEVAWVQKWVQSPDFLRSLLCFTALSC